MQKSGYNSKKFAQNIAQEVRQILISAYPGSWKASVDRRGTRWFYTIDLMDGDSKSGIAVGPALGTRFIAFIATKEIANAVEAADPVECVLKIIDDILNTADFLKGKGGTQADDIESLRVLHGRMFSLLGLST